MILQRYLFREVLGVFAAVLTVLLLVYSSNRLVHFLTEAAAGQLSSDVVFQLLAFKVVENLSVLLPLSLYIAVLLGLGRLYRDSEITAMSAGGIGMRGLAQSVFWFAIGFAIVVAVLTVFVAPRAAAWEESLIQRAKQDAQTSGLQPGRFAEFGEGDQVIYVESVSPDHRRMGNVFVQVRRQGKQYLLVSQSAYQTVQGPEGERFMVLENGYRYSGTPGSADFVITHFEKHAVRLEEGHAELGVYRKRSIVPTSKLLGSDNLSYVAELQGRVSAPISTVLLAMLAVPLARTSPRQGRYAKLFSAVVVYFLYANSIGIAQKLVERGELASAIGVWPVHLAVAAAVAGMLFGQSSGRWQVAARLRGLRRAR